MTPELAEAIARLGAARAARLARKRSQSDEYPAPAVASAAISRRRRPSAPSYRRSIADLALEGIATPWWVKKDLADG